MGPAAEHRAIVRYSFTQRSYETLLRFPPGQRGFLTAVSLADGRRLLYRDDQTGIFILEPPSPKPRLLLAVPGAPFRDSSLAITKDEGWIVFGDSEAEGGVWLLTFQ
jgi:hypothetical protein